MIRHRVGEPLDFELLALRIARFGDAVAVDHERVAGFQFGSIFAGIRRIGRIPSTGPPPFQLFRIGRRRE